MSKQEGYQPLSTEVPNGEDYGFEARLPQVGVSRPTHGTYYANFGPNCTGGAAGGAPMAYPAAAYAGAPSAGYPVTTSVPMVGPTGIVVYDPLGRCGRKHARKQARRMACATYGCHGCRNCRGCHGCRRSRGGPVHLLFGLARSAFQSAQEHRQRQPPAPAHKVGSG